MTPQEHFISIVPHYMELFMKDFDVSLDDAAAVFGNAGYESLGFTKLQEIKPTSGRGGFGWFQWTASRRVDFENYCARNNLEKTSNEANYKFLWVELHNSEKHALEALKKAKTLPEKVKAFEASYERAGIKNYPERQKWAAIAYEAYNNKPVIVHPSPIWDKIIEIVIRLILRLFGK